MRIYNDPFVMRTEVERELFEMGETVSLHSMQDKVISEDDDYLTKELSGYCYSLTLQEDMTQLRKFCDEYGHLKWADREFNERISAGYVNPGTAWTERSEVWLEFIHNNKFGYTYNERYREQLPILIEELRLHPTSRQAILTMYDRHQDHQNLGGKSRVPCSVSYQFLIRDGRLDMFYNMRSCDFLTHFANDVFLTICLQDWVAQMLGIKLGRFVHFIGSLHAYNKDLKDRNIF